MKDLTQEEFDKLQVKGRGRSSAVYNRILNMKPGQIVQIEKTDWKKHYGPSRIASYIGKRYGQKFTTWTIVGDQGWAVKRTA